MPFLGDSDAAPVADVNDYGNPSAAQIQTAALSAIPQDDGSPIGNTLGIASLAPADLLDTVASSKYLGGAFGLKKGDINNAALAAIGQPGLTDFYNQHKEGVETMSGVGGLVASGVIADALTSGLGGNSAFMGAMAKLPGIRRVAALSDEYANAMATVRAADTQLAARGANSWEQYAGNVSVDGLKFDSASGGFVPATINTNRLRATWLAKGLGAAEGAGKALVAEGVSYAALNSNDFLYSDDESQNLTWQALGVGLGAAGELFHSAYQIRKFVNSDELKRAFAGALDPNGVEQDRLLWQGRKVQPLTPDEGFLGGTHTDEITSLLTSANDLRNLPVGDTSDGRSLLANRNNLANQHEALANETVQKVTTKGISTDGNTRFTMDSPGYGNHVAMLMHRDPGGLYGVEMAGGLTDDMGDAISVHQNHMQRLNERINQAKDILADPKVNPDAAVQAQGLITRLQWESTLTPQVLIDGEKMPITEAAAIQGFETPKITFNPETKTLFSTLGIGNSGLKGSGLYEAASPGAHAPSTIDTDLTMHLPGDKDLATTADHFDVLRLYKAANAAIDNMSKWTSPIRIPDNPNFFQLDMAEQILQRSEGSANIQWPKGLDRDSAQVESFAQKAEALQYWQAQQKQDRAYAASMNLDPESNLAQLRVRLNLPRLTAYERGVSGLSESPVETLARGAGTFGPDAVRQMSLQDLKDGVATTKRLGDLSQVSANDVSSLAGNSFTYMTDDQGRAIKPVMLYSRPFKQIEWSPDAVADRLAAQKMSAIQTLTAPDAGPVTQRLTQNLIQNPDMPKAMATHELMDNQIQGSTIGAQPASFVGSVANSVKTTDWIARDNPTILAATRLNQAQIVGARSAMKDVIGGAFGDALNQLKNPRNAASKLLLDQFHTFRGGWDLDAKAIPRNDGYSTFGLSDTVKNQQRWKQAFGNDMPKGQTLVSPQGKEVVLDPMGMDLQQRYNRVSDSLLGEKNTLLRAQGLPQIDSQAWYVPPPSTSGKYLGFTLGPDGKTVPNMSVVADTPTEFSRQKAMIQAQIQEKGLGYTFHSQEEIHQFANIWDRAQMDMINPGLTPVQPGKVARGTLTGPEINMNAFENSMDYARHGYLTHATDLLETMFREQINANKARSAFTSPTVKNRLLGDIKYRNIYDLYNEALLGQSKLNSSGSVVGKLYNPIEGGINKVLEAATPIASFAGQKTQDTWNALNGWINRANPWSGTPAATKDFESLRDALGVHMPFASQAEMLERTNVSARPWTAQDISTKMNQFTSATVLRMFEVAQPIIHLAGIVNAMPAVVRNMMPMAGESLEDHAARVGDIAMHFDVPGKGRISVLDMAKLGAKAFTSAWNPGQDAEWAYRVEHGYIGNQVAEFHNQFGSIQSKGDWERFFLGDNTISNPTNVKDSLKQKGVVGALSILTDNSLEFTRSWGHMIGVELGHSLGLTDLATRESFAHDLANKMIANYAPHNRPEIFQGAIGTNIGLFQSFMQAYYQRLFRYVETKDYGSLVTQLASQAGLFGINSLPGWQSYNNLMTAISSKHGIGGTPNDPQSALRHAVGQQAGDLLSNGVLSNIPTLFGLPGSSLFSRGDINIRLPGTVMPPAWSVLQRIGEGVTTAIKQFADENGTLTHTELAEIVSNMMPNRPVAGMIEQFANGGIHTDNSGQMITDTKNAMETAYRLIGIRSERQSDDLNAYYANKNAMEHKAAADSMLNLATRAALREGNADAIPAIFQKYMENGGDPRRFQQWMRQNYQSANTPRSQRQLDQVLKDPEKMAMVSRLLDAGVSIQSDNRTPDPSDTYGGADQGDELQQPVGAFGSYSGQMTVQPSAVQAPFTPGPQ